MGIYIQKNNNKKRDVIMEIFSLWADSMKKGFTFYRKGDFISDKIYENICSEIHFIGENQIIGFVDTTLFNSGKEGYLFTDDGVFWKQWLSDADYVLYRDIESVTAYSSDDDITFYLKDGSTKYVKWSNVTFDMGIVRMFFDEVIEKLNEMKQGNSENTNIEKNDKFYNKEIDMANIFDKEVKVGGIRGCVYSVKTLERLDEEIDSLRDRLRDISENAEAFGCTGRYEEKNLQSEWAKNAPEIIRQWDLEANLIISLCEVAIAEINEKLEKINQARSLVEGNNELEEKFDEQISSGDELKSELEDILSDARDLQNTTLADDKIKDDLRDL